MIKALLKKQFVELGAFFFLSQKGTRRKTWAIIGFIALMLYVAVAITASFWMIADTLCETLVLQGLGWVYFCLMGLIAFSISCVINFSSAQSQLYTARDNDLLLSLPIPPWKILFARIFFMYCFGFFLSAIAFIPAMIAYMVVAVCTFGQFLSLLALLFILPLGALAVSCLLGGLIALITAKLNCQKTVSLVLFVLFMVGY